MAGAQAGRRWSPDLGSGAPSSPDAAPASCCSAGTCRRSGRPPSEPVAPSAIREGRGRRSADCPAHLPGRHGGVLWCVTWSDVGGKDDEDARGKALVQKLPGQQPGQAAVALQQLLMEPPAKRAADLLLSQQQRRQQLRELRRNQRSEGETTGEQGGTRGEKKKPEQQQKHI